MALLFLEYPKCTTCQKAKKWLEEQQVPFTARHIVEENPRVEELRAWVRLSGLPLARFFNTSGLLYRSMGLKDKLPVMSKEEQLEILASDGMLVKRPLIVSDTAAFPGFREEIWRSIVGK